MLWVYGALILVASFLTWATITPNQFSGFPGGSGPPGAVFGSLFGGMTISLNAWNSNLTLAGLTIPNWLPVVAALGAIGAAFGSSTGAAFPPRLASSLTIYALAQAALSLLIVLFSGRGSVGLGCLLFLGVGFALLRGLKHAADEIQARA